jgi:hypothetical protein
MMLLTLVVLLALAAPAFAASDITVTVTLAQVGVDVSPTSWALGTMAPGTSQQTTSRHFTATNSGNVAEDFTITAGASTPSGWDPAAASGVDEYRMGVTTDAITDQALTPSYTLGSNVAALGTVGFDLKFTAPAAGSTYDAGGETITVSLSASAH